LTLILTFPLRSLGISRFLIFPLCFLLPSVGLPSASFFLGWTISHLLLPPLVQVGGFPPFASVERSLVSSHRLVSRTVGLLRKLIIMVKRGSSTFSAAAVTRSGLALGRRVEKTLALEAEVSCLRHHISVLSRRRHLSTLESEFLRRGLDALRSVAPLSREGDGAEVPSPCDDVAGEVAVHAPVAVPAAPTVASLRAHVEALTVTTVASAIMAQQPEHGVAEPVLLVVDQVERSPLADGTVAKRCLRRLRWVDDEAGVASRKAPVFEVLSSLSPPVPTRGTVLRWLRLLRG